jgi:negative regulator of flagellin synthesis FlgM
MQIDPTRLGRIPATGIEKVASTPAAPEAAPAQAAEAAQGTDKLVLSPQAAEIRAAHEALAAVPDTRTELVERLKAQVEAGTYEIDPDAIAEKMIP